MMMLGRILSRLSGNREVYRSVGLCIALLPMLIITPLSEAKTSLRRSAVVIAVEKVSTAVVNVSTVVRERVSPLFPFSGNEFFRDFFPDLFSREYSRSSLGSGVIIDGQRVPVVGSECMDQTMIKLPQKYPMGTEVVLIGTQGDESIYVEDICQTWKTIEVDVTTILNQRVPRVYIRD